MARKFFFVCAGLLCLAIVFHFGATTAGAQAPSNPVVSVSFLGNGSTVAIALTANGDTYLSGDAGTSWTRQTNVFSSGPVNVERHTLGELKARYR